MVHGVGSLLDIVLNGLLSTTHEGTLECVVPIDLKECEQLVCAQQGVEFRSIWSWGFLVGRFAMTLSGGFGC